MKDIIIKGEKFTMNKFKIFLGVSVLSSGFISSFSQIDTYAAERSASLGKFESTAVGGWNEESGYYVNPQAFSKVMKSAKASSNAKHTGKAESRTHNGTSQKRAHGWTTWVGKYHYTRARMEDGSSILTDSDRVWGTDGTEAISPWWSFDKVTTGSARTYYGC